jgi:hypothetical protein
MRSSNRAESAATADCNSDKVAFNGIACAAIDSIEIANNTTMVHHSRRFCMYDRMVMTGLVVVLSLVVRMPDSRWVQMEFRSIIQIPTSESLAQMDRCVTHFTRSDGTEEVGRETNDPPLQLDEIFRFESSETCTVDQAIELRIEFTVDRLCDVNEQSYTM